MSFQVGVLTSDHLKPWMVRTLKTMVEGTDASVEVVIIEGNDESSNPKLTNRLRHFFLNQGSWGWYWAARAGMRKALGRDAPTHRQYSHTIDEVTVFEDTARIVCNPLPVENGIGNTLPQEAVDALVETDVAIRFGFGIVKGDVLTAPRYGVLSFHHGDIHEYRGQPLGFWEFLHGRDTAGVTLQRLNERLDGGEVVGLKSVDISDAYTWQAVQRRLLAASDDMLSEGINRLMDENFSPNRPTELGPLYTKPNAGSLGKYLLKNTVGKVRAEWTARETQR